MIYSCPCFYRSVKRIDWRFIQTVAFLLTSLASVVYLLAGTPIQRPFTLFVLTGLTLTAPAVQHIIRQGHASTPEVATTLASTMLAGAFLFLSLWNHVIAAGSDMTQHIAIRAGYIMRTGYINPNLGMYTHSPLVHIEYSVIARVTNLWIFEVRFPFLAISILTPFLLFVACRHFESASTGLLGTSFGVAFPLLYRTGASFDSETLVLPFFILVIYLTLKWIRWPDRRLSLLIIGLLIGGGYIHFLYPVLISGFLFGGAVVTNATRSAVNNPDSRQRNTIPTFALFIGAFFIVWRVFWTEKGQSMFLSLVVKGSDKSIPANPLRLFLPSSGAVGRSTSSTAAGSDQTLSIISTLINFAPMLLFIFFGAIGGLIVLTHARNDDQAATITSIAVVTSLLTIVALVALTSASSFRLGFRFYYFVGIVGLVYCAIGAARLLRPPDSIPDSFQTVMMLITIVLIAAFVITGPLSSLGNPVDSRFGGKPLYTDEEDVRHLSALDAHTPAGSQPVPIELNRIELPDLANPISPSYQESGPRTVTSEDACQAHTSPWSSGRFRYCFK